MLFEEESIKDINKDVNINVDKFRTFLIVQKNLSDATVKNHIRYFVIFLQAVGKSIDSIRIEDIQRFMLDIKKTKASETYKNYLSMLKILFRDFLSKEDLIKSFKFPQQQVKPKFLPSRNDLKTFYEELPSQKYKIIFLMLASSGLRISELLSAKIDNKMLIPESHNGSTKQSWLSFFNTETEALLKEYKGNLFETSRDTVSHVFKATAVKTCINITPQTLRSVFAREMSKAGVQDRYIDAFCGRIPQSVLARHYSDYSPEVLKEIYDKANLRIF